MTILAAERTLLSTINSGRGLLRTLACLLLGSLLIAASAQVSVPLKPVPMTMQSMTVLLVGMAYGWRLGASTVLVYLAEGAMGLPVFAGFNAGIPYMMGPTGGYLGGFVLAAAAVGWLAECGWSRSIPRAAVALLVGHAILFIPGLGWLANFIGWTRAITVGFLPFLLGTGIKVALGAVLMRAAWKVAPAERI